MAEGLAIGVPVIVYFVFTSLLCALDCGAKQAITSLFEEVEVTATPSKLAELLKAVFNSPSLTRSVVQPTILDVSNNSPLGKPDPMQVAEPPVAHGNLL